MDTLEAEMRRLEKVTMEDYTVKKRTVGIGVMTAQEAIQLGRRRGRPCAAAAWLRTCARRNTKPSRNSGSRPCPSSTATAGPVPRSASSKCSSPWKSSAAISHLPDTEINVKVKGNPSGEVISRVEQPRGECMYYVKGNGSKYLDRVRIRTPTFANIPPLLHMVKGIQLADVPVVVLSIDPCISCTER